MTPSRLHYTAGCLCVAVASWCARPSAQGQLPAPHAIDSLAWPWAAQISADSLRAQVYALAAPGMEGRETGTAGQRRAADHLRRVYARRGVAPMPAHAGQDTGYFQPYQVARGEIKSLSLRAGRIHTGWGDGAFTISGLHMPTALAGRYVPLAEAEFLAAGTGAMRPDLKGNWSVVQLSPSPRPLNEQIQLVLRGVSRVQRQGGTGLFVGLDDETFARLAAYKARSGEQMSTGNAQPFMLLFVSQRIAAAIAQRPEKLHFKASATTQFLPACNVLARIPGTEPGGEAVVISAHYDHLGMRRGQLHPGADDDASGTAAVLEIARVMQRMADAGIQPRRTVLFAHFSGEEKGLWGSEFYIQHPAIPLPSTIANLNIDMIGRIDPEHETPVRDERYVYPIGADILSTRLDTLNKMISEKYTHFLLDPRYNSPSHPEQFYYRSDHYNFAEKGIPVIFFFTGVHKDYHRPSDTPDKLLYGKMADLTRHIFTLAWVLANQAGRL